MFDSMFLALYRKKSWSSEFGKFQKASVTDAIWRKREGGGEYKNSVRTVFTRFEKEEALRSKARVNQHVEYFDIWWKSWSSEKIPKVSVIDVIWKKEWKVQKFGEIRKGAGPLRNKARMNQYVEYFDISVH